MVFTLFSAIEQRYGVANYEKIVWFKRVYWLLSNTSGDDWGLEATASSLPAKPPENEEYLG